MKRLFLSVTMLFLFWAGFSYLTIPEESLPEEEVFFFSPPPALEEDFSAFTEEYVAYFKSVMAETNTPGAALVIIKNDQVYFMEGMGVKRVKRDSPVDINTVFRIGSLSKGLTASLTGILVDKGVMSWEDKLIDHMPSFQLKDTEQTNRVNLKHVLSHTTGLPYHAYTDMVERGWDLPFINNHFKTVNLIAKEGEIYAYQNAVFSLIGEGMEETTGHHVSTLLDLELFQPLGMVNASTSYEDLIASNNYSYPHAGGGQYWGKRKISKKYFNAIPAGGINASISDMGKYLQLLLGNRPDLLSESALDQIFEPLVNTRNKRKYFRRWPFVEEAYYGLGHRIVTTKDDILIYHGGYVNGYKSELSLNRKDKIGICVLTNAPSALSGRSIPAFWERYDAMKKAKAVTEPQQEFLLPEVEPELSAR